jgi:uncharacterized protein
LKKTLLYKFPKAKATAVAKAGYRAMMSGKDLAIPGLSNKALALATKVSPRRMVLWTSRKLVER